MNRNSGSSEPEITRQRPRPRATPWQDLLCDDGPELQEESFTACLNRYLRRSGLSLTQLARRSWLDISYVSRLVNVPSDPLNPRLGEPSKSRRPSRDTVIRLGLALQLSMEELDELLMAAGYSPLVR